jgi:protein-tyrosine phosphatase
VSEPEPFVDIHCHLVPGIDDGAKSEKHSLAMARMAVEDGISTIIVTPHQLGANSQNDGTTIRQKTAELQRLLDDHGVPLGVLPGGDVRIGPEMIAGLRSGEVMSLADHRRHVLLELPHELYMPLDPVLDNLAKINMVGILSHPERNSGILANRKVLAPLVNAGCLMQVTGDSLTGTFGGACQELAEWMLAQGLVHFLATDAHSPKARRPQLRKAFDRAAELTEHATGLDLCCRNPALVARGEDVPSGRRAVRRGGLASWLGFRKAG